MAALFGDAAVLQDHDPVGRADGGQPVGDDEQGAAGRERGQRVLDQRLGVRVGVRGRLVEDEDRRVGEQRPRDGQALGLTAGQGDARAEYGGVAVGQGQDAVVEVGGAGAPLDLLVGGVGAAQADVVGDARPQQPYVLEDEADPAVQLGRGDVPHVGAAEGDRAGGDVVEAGQQRGQSGLTRAGGPDKRGHGAGHEVEVDAAEDVGAPVVREGDTAHRDVVAVGQDGVGGFGERGGAQQFRQAYGGGLAGPDLLDAGADDAHGGGDGGSEQEEGDEPRGGHSVPGDEDRARQGQEQQHDGRGDDQDGGGGADQSGPHPAGEEVGEPLGRADEPLVCPASASEALEHGDAGRELHGGGGDPPDGGAELGHLRRRAGHGPPEEEHAECEGDHGEQGEAPVDGEKVGQGEDRGGEHGDDVEQGVREQRVQSTHIVVHRLFDLAGALLGEPAQGAGRCAGRAGGGGRVGGRCRRGGRGRRPPFRTPGRTDRPRTPARPAATRRRRRPRR